MCSSLKLYVRASQARRAAAKAESIRREVELHQQARRNRINHHLPVSVEVPLEFKIRLIGYAALAVTLLALWY